MRQQREEKLVDSFVKYCQILLGVENFEKKKSHLQFMKLSSSTVLPCVVNLHVSPGRRIQRWHLAALQLLQPQSLC